MKEISRMTDCLEVNSYKFFKLGNSSTILGICKIAAKNKILRCDMNSNSICISTSNGMKLSIPSPVPIKIQSAKASSFENLLYVKFDIDSLIG